MASIVATPDHVRFGRKQFAFTSFADVSAAFCQTRDRLGATSSGRTGPAMPKCTIHAADGTQVARVSYNGRVWTGLETGAQAELLYDPR